jgi:LacI family transcriptional regulator, galactose operon repressor
MSIFFHARPPAGSGSACRISVLHGVLKYINNTSMTHRFPIKEIALQAGLSTATIDRAINARGHVSPQTKARVAAAIEELEAQEAQLSARGRRMFFDFVIEAPTRFSREVQTATESVLTQVGAAVCRPRFLIQEIMEEADAVKTLDRIAKRGSHGVCLKARDLPTIRAAVGKLSASGIPVVTLVSDIQTPARTAYVGLDNHSAGATAAYLVAKTLGDVSGTVLALRSNDRFLGEEEREMAFTGALSDLCPNLSIVNLSGGSGVHYETSRVLHAATDQLGDLRAVYSIGGGNRTILEVLRQIRCQPDIYIAHDLDQENRALIAEGHLSFILHHDLRADMQNVFQAFLCYHKLLPDGPMTTISNVQVITPRNIPPRNRRLRA